MHGPVRRGVKQNFVIQGFHVSSIRQGSSGWRRTGSTLAAALVYAQCL
jgi:hypothetical protein